MNKKLLELHFSLLVKSWQKSKTNIFSDTSKKEYTKQLRVIFDHLKDEDFSKLSDVDLELRHVTIDFFFKSLEFLDNSTANLIPFEIIEGLKFALEEWITDSKNYIIVTSLRNDIKEFSLDPNLVFIMDKYFELEKTFNAVFERKLIQINLPKYLSRDYLSNVVLYHELGHFVDLKHRISDAIYNDLTDKEDKRILSIKETKAINEYFPYYFNTAIPEPTRKSALKLHIGEYFSDLFASQYVGKTSNYYIDYITFYDKSFNPSHPSSEKRSCLVNAFVDKKDDALVAIFVDAVKKSASKELKLRFIYLPKDDFLNLLPYEISSFEEISSLFVLGWDIWLNNIEDFQKINNMNYEPKPSDIFLIINNLIEKSVSNFVVKNVWEKTKSHVSI